ncbi:MAG: hypothetical protein QXO40_05000 [Candidatus Aenigmatarchaeota archaeon]
MAAKGKAKKEEIVSIGEIAFLAGILIAVISGILIVGNVISQEWLVNASLALLGTIVGLLNIRKEEYTTFLLASLIFLLPLGVESITGLEWLSKIIKLIGVFVLPAALITAFKAVWDTAHKK